MAPHSSTLAWKIPWTEKPGRLQSMGSLRARHDWATSLWLFTFMHWRRKWQPTPVLLPRESQGRGAWLAAVYGVTQSRTRLKRLSSSSSSRAHFRWHLFLEPKPETKCLVLIFHGATLGSSGAVSTQWWCERWFLVKWTMIFGEAKRTKNWKGK